MTNTVLLNSAFRDNLLSLQQTRELIDRTSERLATGRKVNSALDDAQNFFTARALNFRSNDLSRLLDGIGSSLRTIEQASSANTALLALLDQGDALADDAISILNGDTLSSANASSSADVPSLNSQITADNPAVYYRFEEQGTNANNLGSIGTGGNGPFIGGATGGGEALYSGGTASIDLDGVDDGLVVPNNLEINLGSTNNRTIEMVFNADTTSGRQVLYEEGGLSTNFGVYILDGSLYVSYMNSGAGPFFASTAIEADTTYHVALTYSVADNEFKGFLNGNVFGTTAANGTIVPHSGNIGLGFMNDAFRFHDISQNTGDDFFFDGQISDFALYNQTLSETDISNRATAVVTSSITTQRNAFISVLGQIDNLVQDAVFRGIGLLNNDDLVTYLNEDRSNQIKIEGQDFTATGLGLDSDKFFDQTSLEELLADLRDAKTQVRNFGNSLANSLNILQIREDFIEAQIVTTASSADDLTQADMNEEGANLLAAQTREQLGVTSLSLAAASSTTILNLFA